MVTEVFTKEQTIDLAKNIAKNAKKGDIYCICGELGSGKTHFAKGFSLGLNIKEDITSPTFTIVNEYNVEDMPFFHFDVYRINDVQELINIGYEEYFYGDGICLIEWADMIKDIIPKNAIWINIKKNMEKGDEYRIVEVLR